jgi:hypothetical protein
MSAPDDRKTKALEDIGYKDDAEALKPVLHKFRHDRPALEAVMAGVKRAGRGEDSGDWTSSASPGWSRYIAKKKLVEEAIRQCDRAFLLEEDTVPQASDRQATRPFNAQAPRQNTSHDSPATPPEDPRIAEMQAQIDSLTQRVQRLEGMRYKLAPK